MQVMSLLRRYEILVPLLYLINVTPCGRDLMRKTRTHGLLIIRPA